MSDYIPLPRLYGEATVIALEARIAELEAIADDLGEALDAVAEVCNCGIGDAALARWRANKEARG